MIELGTPAGGGSDEGIAAGGSDVGIAGAAGGGSELGPATPGPGTPELSPGTWRLPNASFGVSLGTARASATGKDSWRSIHRRLSTRCRVEKGKGEEGETRLNNSNEERERGNLKNFEVLVSNSPGVLGRAAPPVLPEDDSGTDSATAVELGITVADDDTAVEVDATMVLVAVTATGSATALPDDDGDSEATNALTVDCDEAEATADEDAVEVTVEMRVEVVVEVNVDVGVDETADELAASSRTTRSDDRTASSAFPSIRVMRDLLTSDIKPDLSFLYRTSCPRPPMWLLPIMPSNDALSRCQQCQERHYCG